MVYVPVELVVAVPPGEPVTVWAVTQIPVSADPVDASVTVPLMEPVPDVRGVECLGAFERCVTGLVVRCTAAEAGNAKPEERSTMAAKGIVTIRTKDFIVSPMT